MKLINEQTDLLKLSPAINTLLSSQTIVGRSGRIHQVRGSDFIPAPKSDILSILPS